MNEAKRWVFACGDCGNTYGYEDSAMNCCGNDDPDDAVFWECGDCGELYPEKEQAHQCCWDGEDDLEPYIPSAAELEAAGQQRLPL